MSNYFVTIERYVLQEADVIVEADSRAEAETQAMIRAKSGGVIWETLDDSDFGDTKGLRVQMSCQVNPIGPTMEWELEEEEQE